MKVTLHLEGTKEDMAGQVLEFVQLLANEAGPGHNDDKAREEVQSERATKRGRKPKAAELQVVEEEAIAAAIAAEEDDFSFEEEEEPEVEVEVEEISDKTLLDAFNAFAKKKEGNREKAKTLLAKLKVKSVVAIPADKRAEVIKQLASK